MSYAVRNDGLGWRAVAGPDDCTADETWQAATPQIIVPVTEIRAVTTRQARLALLNAGKLQDVENVLNSLPEPQKTAALIEWNHAASIEKYSPLIQSMAPIVGFTSSSLTALFNLASTL